MAENIYTRIFKILTKRLFVIIFLCILIALLIFFQSISYSSVIKKQVQFAPNNISTWIWNTGVFNQDLRTNNTAGFSWGPREAPGVMQPRFAIFTSGLCIGAYVNGNLRMANASYSGEYCPGYVSDSSGIPLFKTDARFKLYSVKIRDNVSNNPDVVGWKDMVPYGAPFEDINNNKIYDIGVDKPGMPDALQTVFVCLTDADPSNHTSSEGFSGGTLPLFAEVHLTAWGYDLEPLNIVQFLKWEIINKNDSGWQKTYFSIVTDPDLGDADDDYIGCDTSLQLAYCYNSDDVDGNGTGRTYGANPPSVGQSFLRSAISRNNNSIDTLRMTSVGYFKGTSAPGAVCEEDPSSAPSLGYNYMLGIKKDGTPWLNPTTNPPSITKFCYSGDPETGIGWTEYFGKINNCGGVIKGNVEPSFPGDRRFILTSGSAHLMVNPGDTQKIVIAQMVGKGSSNLNAVTKLKQTTELTRRVYYQAIEGKESSYIEPPVPLPILYKLFQNYPNPFNPVTTIRYEMKKQWNVKIQVYDMRGELIKTLVNEEKPQGSYEIKFDASNLPSGIYFIKMVSGGGFEDSKKMVVLK